MIRAYAEVYRNAMLATAVYTAVSMSIKERAMKKLIIALAASSTCVPATPTSAAAPENLLTAVVARPGPAPLAQTPVPLREIRVGQDKLWRDVSGKLWFRSSPDSGVDMYWVNLTDISANANNLHAVEIIGEHSRNRQVNYRASSMRVTIDCKRLTWRLDRASYYGSSGTLLRSAADFQWARVRVGSPEEDWSAVAC